MRPNPSVFNGMITICGLYGVLLLVSVPLAHATSFQPLADTSASASAAEGDAGNGKAVYNSPQDIFGVRTVTTVQPTDDALIYDEETQVYGLQTTSFAISSLVGGPSAAAFAGPGDLFAQASSGTFSSISLFDAANNSGPGENYEDGNFDDFIPMADASAFSEDTLYFHGLLPGEFVRVALAAIYDLTGALDLDCDPYQYNCDPRVSVFFSLAPETGYGATQNFFQAFSHGSGGTGVVFDTNSPSIFISAGMIAHAQFYGVGTSALIDPLITVDAPPGVTVTSASGYAYPTGTSITPEPSTFFLLGIGLAGLAVWRWRRIASGAGDGRG